MRPPRAVVGRRAALRHFGLIRDRGDWVVADQLLACAYPKRPGALAGLATQGITVLVNLHERPHDPAWLARHGLREVHLPVPDFTPPTPDQLERGVAAIAGAVVAGQRVAVHCGAGLGRTGTLLACYLVHGGQDSDAAITAVRAARPGSVETEAQAEAVRDYARRRRG